LPVTALGSLQSPATGFQQPNQIADLHLMILASRSTIEDQIAEAVSI
jgi:hypothetical protein